MKKDNSIPEQEMKKVESSDDYKVALDDLDVEDEEESDEEVDL